MEKCFVSGGGGFIAGHTIERLKELGISVVTNVRSQSVRPDYLKDCEVYSADIRDKSAMYSIIERVDGVIHLAGILGTKHVTNAWNFYDVNVKGAINLLEACKEFNVTFVGIGVGNYWMENNYANSKYAAEREIIKYAKYGGVKANVVRALNAYGPRQRVKHTGKIVSTFIHNALRNLPIEVYGGKEKSSFMDMVYVKDVAKVLVEVLQKSHESDCANCVGKVLEAGTGKAYRVWDIAQMVVSMTHSKSEIIEVPMREGESEKSEVIAKVPYPIEYMPFEEGLIKTIKYYQQIL